MEHKTSLKITDLGNDQVSIYTDPSGNYYFALKDALRVVVDPEESAAFAEILVHPGFVVCKKIYPTDSDVYRIYLLKEEKWLSAPNGCFDFGHIKDSIESVVHAHSEDFGYGVYHLANCEWLIVPAIGEFSGPTTSFESVIEKKMHGRDAIQLKCNVVSKNPYSLYFGDDKSFLTIPACGEDSSIDGSSTNCFAYIFERYVAVGYSTGTSSSYIDYYRVYRFSGESSLGSYFELKNSFLERPTTKMQGGFTETNVIVRPYNPSRHRDDIYTIFSVQTFEKEELIFKHTEKSCEVSSIHLDFAGVLTISRPGPESIEIQM